MVAWRGKRMVWRSFFERLDLLVEHERERIYLYPVYAQLAICDVSLSKLCGSNFDSTIYTPLFSKISPARLRVFCCATVQSLCYVPCGAIHLV